MNPKQQYIRQAIKCVPKSLHKVIQECISLHKAKPLKNHMFNITRSKATKEFSASTCNYMLQSRISSSALETCPARHETKPCPRTRSELLSITSSALQPGVAGWIFWSQFWIPWLKLKQINQISLIHTTAQVNLLKGGGWQNHVLRVCRGVTLWDLQAQARAVLSCSSATVTKQIIP